MARQLEPIPEGDILRIPAGPGALHVERFGQGGEAVVLLHGFPTSAFLWRTVAPLLAIRGHTAYAMDLMGYGESDRPIDGDFSIAAQADYVDRAITALRIARPWIVGVDIGGGVAQRVALLRGERLAGLVLVNSVAFDECPGREVPVVQRAVARFALRVARSPLGAAPLIREVLDGSVADPERMPPRLVARYLAPFAGSDGVPHLLTLAGALDAEDIEDLELGAIRAPAMIVWGEEDRWLDSGLGERLQGALPDARLVRIPGVARLVPEEAPELLTDLLLEFMAGPRDAGRPADEEDEDAAPETADVGADMGAETGGDDPDGATGSDAELFHGPG